MNKVIQVNKKHLSAQTKTNQSSTALQFEKTLIEHAKKEPSNILDSIPLFIALIDKNHNIVRLNMPMANALGMHPRELVGQKCFEFCHKTREIPDSCPHKRAMEEGISVTVALFEKNLGGHVEVTATPFFDPDGTLIGSIHVVRDINKRKKAEEEKEEIISQLLQAQKLEEVGRLAAGIAHEINTPSQYVASNLEFLKESFDEISPLVNSCAKLIQATSHGDSTESIFSEAEKALEDTDWEYLREELPLAISQAQEGIDRVTKIVRAMKEFSHPGPKEKTYQDINRIIETTVTISKNEWKYVSDVYLDLQEDIPPVYCIADEIGQVILNMVVNAAQAISEKLGENPEGAKGSISISTEKEKEYAKIIVKDTGTGIPEDILNRIFDSFFTTKEAGRGTGQGLSIAKDIVEENHDGSISVTSVACEGTSFTIRLPFNDSAQRD